MECVPGISRKMGLLKACRTRLFFIFWQIIGKFDVFTKFRSLFSVLQFEKSSNMEKKLAKTEENPCLTCLPTHFSTVLRLISGTRSSTIST